MKYFTEKDENRQFISVHILDGSPSSNLLAQLKTVFDGISRANVITDHDELLIEIPTDSRNSLGFSLGEFKRITNTFAQANVQCFTVDLEEQGQRMYW